MKASQPGDAVAPELSAPARICSEDWIARVHDIASVIIAHRDQGEAKRRLARPIIEALRDAGFYRMWVPRALGGHEVDPITMLRVVEELARLDGATAWSMMACANSALLAARLPLEGAAEVFGDPDVIVAGSLHDGGFATRVPGGYRVAGRWRLASGSMSATWLLCAATVIRDGGEPDESRIFFVPATGATVIDVWQAIGIRASETNDFVVDDLFVPERRCTVPAGERTAEGPLYAGPMAQLINPPLGAVALGIGAEAIDAFVELAQVKRFGRSAVAFSEHHGVQERVGEAYALVASGRAYLHSAMARYWDEMCRGRTDNDSTADVLLAAAVAAKNAVEATGLMFTTAGSTSLLETSRLERCFRDVNVVNHHEAASIQIFERVGRYKLTGR